MAGPGKRTNSSAVTENAARVDGLGMTGSYAGGAAGGSRVSARVPNPLVVDGVRAGDEVEELLLLADVAAVLLG